jgi:hypothetical protein
VEHENAGDLLTTGAFYTGLLRIPEEAETTMQSAARAVARTGVASSGVRCFPGRQKLMINTFVMVNLLKMNSI